MSHSEFVRTPSGVVNSVICLPGHCITRNSFFFFNEEKSFSSFQGLYNPSLLAVLTNHCFCLCLFFFFKLPRLLYFSPYYVPIVSSINLILLSFCNVNNRSIPCVLFLYLVLTNYFVTMCCFSYVVLTDYFISMCCYFILS